MRRCGTNWSRCSGTRPIQRGSSRHRRRSSHTPWGTGQSQMIGRQLGPYTIVAPLGSGGMGEVYRARDSKLGRDVAIKILPSHFTADPERRSRFAREARLLATLNHPAHRRDLRAGRNRWRDGAGPRAGRRTDACRSPFARAVADRRVARDRAPDRRGARRGASRKGSSIAI